jgi:Zn-dependent protease/predicted transcriptional regulator
MNWSWRIGRIAGIDVFIHFTFFLLLAWIAYRYYALRGSVADALGGVAFILALFGVVVLHELGHALAARRYGIATRDITLLPIGGVARLERMPDEPAQELVVALAGPAVNVVIAAAIFVVTVLGAELTPVTEATRVGGAFLSQMFWVNVALVVFNLLPAFPMDGGRVLRALLAMKMDYVRATQIAATVGQAMAILFFIGGLFGGNPMLMFIGLFVWLGAMQESSFTQMKSALSGIPVGRAMVTNFETLDANDPLARAIDHVIAGFQQDFPVVEDGRLVGVLRHNELAPSIAEHGTQVRVGDVMRRDITTVSPREMLEYVYERLQQDQCHTLPVVENGRLVGLLTCDNVTEVLMIREAMRTAQSRQRTGASGGPSAGEAPVYLQRRPAAM